ncbi:MAG: T9SS type A sorting domain-containing protein [Bacteroidetes bacterium]|nr:T9SS type A sorting domain-containing protein [Bacteroidota bacterium]MBS1975518.1 T9SS type A sorting domain-containing protein [Bacteroidota bacterium]
MKNVYFVLIASSTCLMTFVPKRSTAQCLCSSGLPATPITQSITIAPKVSSSLTFNFNQFDPSVGTLSCVSLKDTVTIVTTSSALNTGPDSTAFLFQLTVPSKITAPGITINKVFNKTYGYDTLSPHGVPGYSITYGPDTIALNNKGSGSTGGNAAYIGIGTVGITFAITGGGLSVLDGGLNDTTSVATTLAGTLNLTYYWCPASALASLITNFTAAQNGNYVQLKWQSENEQKGISYAIEYSSDGHSFTPAGTLISDSNSDGTSADYQYEFSIPQNTNGKLFFRIMRITADGNSAIYSPVKMVNIGGDGSLVSYRIYPNPVSTFAMIEFDKVLSGNFTVDLANTAGQVVRHKTLTLSGSNQIKLDLISRLATGLYYLHIHDQLNNRQYISKLIIE